MNEIVRVLYRMEKIGGTDITVFECGEIPDPEYGQNLGAELFDRTYNTKNKDKNVFYEVYISGSNSVLFKTKNPPTDEEIDFQLKNSSGVVSINIAKLFGGIVGVLVFVYIGFSFIKIFL